MGRGGTRVSKSAALCWPLPEWMHVMMGVYLGRVPALAYKGTTVLGYRWVRFAHKP